MGGRSRLRLGTGVAAHGEGLRREAAPALRSHRVVPARDARELVLVVCNFTPVPRHGYRVGVPVEGFYRELLNTDAGYYGGSNLGNAGGVWTERQAWTGGSRISPAIRS